MYPTWYMASRNHKLYVIESSNYGQISLKNIGTQDDLQQITKSISCNLDQSKQLGNNYFDTVDHDKKNCL